MKILYTILIATLQVVGVYLQLTGKLVDNRKKKLKKWTQRGVWFLLINLATIAITVVLYYTSENELQKYNELILSKTDSLKRSQSVTESATKQLLFAGIKSDSLRHSIDSITNSAHIVIQAKQDLVIENSEKLDIANQKIQNLQADMITNIVGSGFPIFSAIYNDLDNFRMSVVKSSKYPIIDLMFQVIDSDKLRGCKNKVEGNTIVISQPCFDSAMIYSSDSQSLSSQEKTLLDITFPKSPRNFIIISSSKHQSTMQYYMQRFDSVAGDWRIYTKIFELTSNGEFKNLYETSEFEDASYEEYFFYKKRLARSPFF